ncbi:MAG: anti-sigma factor [Roseiflexaceae bacterium]|nr:anti-sigma factor [Roseiflexaceae bacterium]
MNKHPTELLPGYVLDLLGEHEAHCVAAHLHRCPQCRDEVDAFQHSITSDHVAPPPRVKHKLMARITASQHYTSLNHAARSVQPDVRWLRALSVTLLVAVVVFGGLMLNEAQRLRSAATALAEISRAASREEAAIARFLRDPATISHPLHGRPQVVANMYMQAGHTRTVLLISGLPAPAPGHIYQFWLADESHQVAAGTFVGDHQGIAQLVFDAPLPVDAYAEAMVTIEPNGGSASPTGDIVLAAKLAA